MEVKGEKKPISPSKQKLQKLSNREVLPLATVNIMSGAVTLDVRN